MANADRIKALILAALLVGWALLLTPALPLPTSCARRSSWCGPGCSSFCRGSPWCSWRGRSPGAVPPGGVPRAPPLAGALPLLLFWVGLLGGVWSRGATLGLVGAATGVLGWRLWRGGLPRPARAEWGWALGLGGVFLATLAVRLWVIRGVPYPSWTDSYHHTLITQVILDGGRVPTSYQPYAPLDSFHYHFGYHAYSAFLAWLTGLPAHRAVLWGGQVLNALTVPSLFLFVDRLARDRRAALLAATIAGLVCWLPAYYVNWGRYTQLAGHVLLPGALVLTVEALVGGRRAWREALVGGGMAAAVGLTHYRVAIFFLAGAFVVALVAGVRARRGLGRPVAGALAMGAPALVLVGPWLPAVLSRSAEAAREVAARGEVGQLDYFTLEFVLIMGLPRIFLGVSIAAALWMLARARRRPLGALILLWLGLVLFLANPSASGVPDGFLENGAVIVALYMPASLLLGLALSDAASLVAERLGPGRRRWAVDLALTLGLAWTAYRGVSAMLSWGYEPLRAFVTNSDLPALEWIREHTPPEARFAVASNFWLPEGLEGVDAGFWIPYATGRQTTLPPMIYINEASPAEIAATNALARAMSQAPSAQAFAGVLRGAGAEYAYRGLRVEMPWYRWLSDEAHFQSLYEAEGVGIYRLR